MELVPFKEIELMGGAISKSGLFGIKKPEEFVALALIAQAEGRHPAIVARDYHIINGRPALKADAILSRYQEAGGKVQWITLTDDKVEAKFSHESSGTVSIDWTIDRAKKAELLKNPMWQKYPRQMLRSRVVSEGIRTSYPAVLTGVYTVEEVQDMVYEKIVEIKDTTKEVKEFKGFPLEKITPEQVQILIDTCDKNKIDYLPILGKKGWVSFGDCPAVDFEKVLTYLESLVPAPSFEDLKEGLTK